MSKFLIDRNFLLQLEIENNSEFVMKKGYMLTSFAKDFFYERNIKVIHYKNDFENKDLKERIIKILKNDYYLNASEIEKIIDIILKRF